LQKNNQRSTRAQNQKGTKKEITGKMNLPDYFNPVDFSHIKSNGYPLGKYSLGLAVEKNSAVFSTSALSKADVALIGVPFENGKWQKKGLSASDNIRKALYRLSAINHKLHVTDLGNLKPATSTRGTFLALRDAVEYLRETDVIPVIIGGSQDLTLGICEAFQSKSFFWFSTIDSVLDVKKGVEPFHSGNYLTRLFKTRTNLFQFSLIGYQNHLTGEKLMEKTKGLGEHIRLGQLRDNIQQAELILRSSDVLSFDMGAVKYTEAPSTHQKNPNGLRGEEACLLARYAGLSQQMKAFGLFGVKAVAENCITHSLAAEIIWYFLEGVSCRRQMENRTVYKVQIDGLDHPVVFLHEPKTDRWWFEVQSIQGETIEIACSKEEYNQSADNEIPERWLKFVQKMDSLSK
jgi:formiminoglutamase